MTFILENFREITQHTFAIFIFQVALYKYEKTEWEKTNIEGTLFVYERKCEPTYGFLILNRLSATNLVQPVTKDIDLQDKSPFLLYKLKVRIRIIPKKIRNLLF